MLDRLMFAYSRSLSSIADTERRVRANLFKLEQKERVSYGEILQGLDKLMTMQKTQEDVAARAIQSLDARCADLHREMDARCADWHREMEEKVQQEREVAARAIDSRCADLNREMEEKVQQEREKAQQQSSRMQAETDALFARLNDLTQMVQQLSGVLEESNASNRSLTADKDELESKFQSSEREKMEMQDTLERALERLTQENDNLNEGISKQASEILQLQRALQALDQQLQDALHALDKMTALFNASTAERVQLQAESADTIKKLHDERSLLCDERSLLSDERSLLLKRVEELEANHRAVGIRAQLAEDQVRDLTATLNSLKTERDTLQHQKVLRSSDAHSRSLAILVCACLCANEHTIRHPFSLHLS
jgi:chromosome segregation ATPase